MSLKCSNCFEIVCVYLTLSFNVVITVLMCNTGVKYLDPVVQGIVSLTISLRHKFVKQISAKVTKNNSVFVILMLEILTKR